MTCSIAALQCDHPSRNNSNLRWGRCMFRPTVALAAILIGILLSVTSPVFAQNPSQSATSHGLTVYFGVVPAEIARGVAKGHGETDMHGGQPSRPTTYHLIVAVFNAVNGERIIDAKVTASMTRPGPETPPKPLQPMKIANTVTYGNFFDLPEDGIYRIRLSITRKGSMRPIEIDLTYDHEVKK